MRGFASLLLASLVLLAAGCPAKNGGADDDDDDDAATTATPEPTITSVGELVVYDFGTIDIPTSGSQTFTFDAPAGTIGIQLMSIGGANDRDVYFAFDDVIAPGNREVIDGSGNGPARQWFGTTVNCLSIPNDDSATTAVAAGTWTFEVGAWNPSNDQPSTGAPKIIAKVRTASGAPPDGLLDLNIIVVEGIGFTAADLMNGTGAAGAEMQAALTLMDTLYATAGIAIGDIDWIDLPSSASYGTISTRTEAEELFLLSAGFPEARVNVFIVDGFDSQLNGIYGTSGGIPEPAAENGSVDSGTAIALQGSGTETGELIAHEVGHALGAFHTTETNGSTWDLISDTPECPNYPTSCPDASNVMYPNINGATYTGFSAGQTGVIKVQPHIRAAPSAFARRPAAPPYETGAKRGAMECRNGEVGPLTAGRRAHR